MTRLALVLLLAFTARTVLAQPERLSTDLAREMSVDEDGRVYWLTVPFTEGGEAPRVRRYWAGEVQTLESGATNIRGLRARAPFLFLFRGEDLERHVPDYRSFVLHRAASTASPVAPVVGAGFVYWVEGNRVLRIRSNGNSPVEDVTAAAFAPGLRSSTLPPPTIGGIAIDDTHLYWVEHTAAGGSVIWRIRVDGTDPQVMNGFGVAVRQIAVDDANVYAATTGSPAGPSAGVYTISKTDFRRRTLVAEMRGAETFGLAIDRANVYWSVRVSVLRNLLIRAPLYSTGPSVTLREQPDPFYHLQATSAAIYWSDRSGIQRWPQSRVVADVSVRGIEVTQGLQASSHDVPLVAGRPTLLRVYADLRGDVPGATVTGWVFGSRGSVRLPGSPIPITRASIGSFGTAASRIRMDPAATPLVVLPRTWTAGSIELRVELSAAEGVFTDPDLTNNRAAMSLQFTRKEGLCLVTRPLVAPSSPTAVYRVTEPSFPLIVERFLSVYPIADFRVHEIPTPLTIPELTDAIHLGTIWRSLHYEDVGSCDDEARRTHIGLVHPGTSTPGMGGLAYAAGAGWAKMEVFGSDLSVSDFTAVPSGITLAHESLHTDWWAHVVGRDRSARDGSTGQCIALPPGQPIDNGYPYPDGLIDSTTIRSGPFEGQPRFVLEQHYGWDRMSGTFIRPDDTFDLMSYCRNVWINDFHWRDVFRMFRTLPDSLADGGSGVVRLAASVNAHLVTQPAVFFSGTVDPETQAIEAVTMFPVFDGERHMRTETWPSPLQHKIEFQPVPLRLQMLDANGDIIGTDNVMSLPVFDGPGDRRQVFSVTAQIPAGAAGVRIINDKDDVLWKWLGGDDPPLELGGLEVSQSDNQLRITWKSGGAPERRHLIEYSPDGNQWQSISLDHAGNELAVDTTHFPGGKSARVRVTTYTGLVSKTIVSEPFAVASKSPIASIVGPDSKRTLDRGAPVLLRGFAYDAEDGSLPGQSMHWSIDGYGDIGSGDWAALPELPAGTHIVRLTVTDREQRPGEAKTEIRIAEPRTLAPAQ